MMLSITPLLDRNDETPIYLQLYQYIRSGIESGLLGEKGRLPSIRQLVAHLNISKNTVEAAYSQLHAEGYVESRERGGYSVLPLDEWTTPLTKPTHKLETPSHIQLPNPEYDFRYGDIAFDRFPQTSWKACLAEALTTDHSQVLGYGDPLGHAGLRQQIADYVFQSRGVVCQPDHLFIGAGTQQVISMLLQLLELRNRLIAIEEPGYNGVKTVLRHSGCRIVPVEVNQDGIQMEKLERTNAKFVYVTPSHQFPLGMVMPIQKRYRLLQWAREQNSFIIEDDYDSEFRYNSSPIPSLKALDSEDRVIYLGTFSKSFLPAARLSFVVLPLCLMGEVNRKLMDYSQSVSPIIQQAVWLFMRQGHFTRHIRRMRRVYQSRHKALIDAIRDVMGVKTEVIGDRSGMHLLLDVKGRNAKELIQSAEAHGCRVYSPLKHWEDPSNCPESYVMLGFGGMNEQQLHEGVIRLHQAWFLA